MKEYGGWEVMDLLNAYGDMNASYINVYRDIKYSICKIRYEPKKDQYTIVGWYRDPDGLYLTDNIDVIDMFLDNADENGNLYLLNQPLPSYNLHPCNMPVTYDELYYNDSMHSLTYRVEGSVPRKDVFDAIDKLYDDADILSSVTFYTPIYNYTFFCCKRR